MDLRFELITDDAADREALTTLLSGEEWPFHGTSRPSQETVGNWVAAGNFGGQEVRSFWIRLADEVAGIVVLRDLGDPTALFDLRLRSDYRGRGIGAAAVRWLTGYVFTEFSGIWRIEGHTRRDNLAMQHVLERCGYVREAHHRQAWPSSDGSVHDSYGYAILRQDWASGETTPVEL